jgi:predicted MFS family arabinose efflux permease
MRAKVVARALAGAPAAWVVGMPAIGLVTDTSWRLAFIAVPLPSAVVTAVFVLRSRPSEEVRQRASLTALLARSGARSWALGELLAISAWAGTLVFSGALFIETYGTSQRVTGLLLAAVALTYLVGNSLGPRIRGACSSTRALALSNVAAATAIAAMWAFTPNLFVTLALFAFASAVFAARTVVGTTYGFTLAGERQFEVGTARAVMQHLGYLAGSLLGGAMFALGGRAAVGMAFAALLLAAAAPYLTAWTTRCDRQREVVVAA